MKPHKSILDMSFAYTPAAATTVEATWRKYGWKPLTEQERSERLRFAATNNGGSINGTANVIELPLLRTA